MKREHPDDQDSVWQSIVENYGERAELDADDDLGSEPVVEPVAVETAPVAEPEDAFYDDDEVDDDEIDVDGFHPDNPPPIPMPPPDRFLAWLGVFGSPTVLLICLIFSIGIPSLLSWVLIGGFIGGFCYLVFTDPREPRDPWDDGAVV